MGLKAEVPWPIVAVELWQTQVAFAIGLMGIYGGWKGTISGMTGFYDLAGAVKHLIYGIVVGMLLAVFVDRMILSSVILSYLNIIGAFTVAILIAAAESAFVLFLLSRSRTASLRASPPFGWALGLGIGSMQACVLIFRLFGLFWRQCNEFGTRISYRSVLVSGTRSTGLLAGRRTTRIKQIAPICNVHGLSRGIDRVSSSVTIHSIHSHSRLARASSCLEQSPVEMATFGHDSSCKTGLQAYN